LQMDCRYRCETRKADLVVPYQPFARNLLVENTRERPTGRAEGDRPVVGNVGSVREGPKGGPHPMAWTRDLAPRDPLYLVRLWSLEPRLPMHVSLWQACFPCFPLPRPRHLLGEYTFTGYLHLTVISTALTSVRSLIPYDIVCPPSQSHHHIRIHFCTTTPPSQFSRYLHPAHLQRPGHQSPELGPSCPFPA
jgi:hypothetical protein